MEIDDIGKTDESLVDFVSVVLRWSSSSEPQDMAILSG